MSILPHTITGAVAGSLAPNTFLAFLIGAVTHFLLDFIPHFDPDLTPKSKPNSRQTKFFYAVVISIDVGLSLILLGFLWQYPLMFWGGLGGAIVDADNFLRFKFKSFPLLSKIGLKVHEEDTLWHNKLNFSPKWINLVIGIIMQGVICLAGLVFIYLQVR